MPPAPRWWVNPYSAQPSESRVRCPDCRGHRSGLHRADVARCPACMGNLRPCDTHACRTCAGRGAVCPVCRGAGWCRVPHPHGATAERCAVCLVGETAILIAVRGYMEEHSHA